MVDSIKQTVDIIVPCYNYARYLRECVHSILKQSGSSVRVLIINDASPDNTGEVASELAKLDSRITYFEHKVNKGHIYSYNEGIEWASADYFLLLSADDYLLPGALERAASLMQRHPSIGFTFGAALEVYERGREVLASPISCNHSNERILSSSEFVTLCGHRNIVPTPTAIIRTQLQKQVGSYRPELPHAGDMEMWLRLAAQAQVGYIASTQAVYRRHSNNMSLSYTAFRRFPDIEQRRAALQSFFNSLGTELVNSDQIRRGQLKLFALEAVGLASEAFNEGDSKMLEQFSSFAVQSFPEITRTWPWTKLAIKRVIGRRTWQELTSCFSRPQKDNIESGSYRNLGGVANGD
jgi:glycosyltransferase involved in cell wall biosynthesis